MKHFMNALLTTTLLTLPSAFAADAFVSDAEKKNECAALVPVTPTAAQGPHKLKDLPQELWYEIVSYLDGKSMYRFQKVSHRGRNCLPFAIITQAKAISGIAQFQSFPPIKTISLLPLLHSLISEMFSELMHENKILDVSGTLTTAGIECVKMMGLA